eukprot:Nk52_evm1s2473 gene=Nk52_evmTU1s2473
MQSAGVKEDSLEYLRDKSMWAERTEVVTKEDHEQYTKYATEILWELVDKLTLEASGEEGPNKQAASEASPAGARRKLPLIPQHSNKADEAGLPVSSTSSIGEASITIPKVGLGTQEKLEKANSPKLDNYHANPPFEETFVSSDEIVKNSNNDTAFQLDFLEQISSKVQPGGARKSLRCRESIYRKFDPYAGVNSPARNRIEPVLSSPIPECVEETPSNLEKTTKPPKFNLQTIEESPANTPQSSKTQTKSYNLIDSDSIPSSPNIYKYTQADVDEIIDKERKRAAEEAGLGAVEFEKLVKELEGQLEAEKAKNLELKSVLDQFESTISKMIDDGDKLKAQHIQEITELRKEKEGVSEDLQSVETSFGDLYRRYEKLKEMIESYKSNETILKDSVAAVKKDLENSEQRYEALKKHAEDKIQSANEDIERVKENNRSEIAVLRAKLLKAESRAKTCEHQLEAKEKENAELLGICDELIAKLDGAK